MRPIFFYYVHTNTTFKQIYPNSLVDTLKEDTAPIPDGQTLASPSNSPYQKLAKIRDFFTAPKKSKFSGGNLENLSE